ncbi:MAG: Ni/Fe hydrogenase subunit alpha [Acidimicrobiales bacterium]
MTHQLSPSTSAQIDVPVLARVEGEGAMHVEVVDGRAGDITLEIYEPPRFFEGFLRGRGHAEPVDLTARICGICPVAYQMSASHAIERACGVTVGGTLRELRRLLYCGEWIESHVLHIGFLHAPDFLGYASGIAIAADHPEMIQRVLSLKKAGNDVVEVLGGRPIHPINPRLGGFHRAPTVAELRSLLPGLAEARDTVIDLVRWTAGFEFPELALDYEFVSLRHDDEYPFNEGRIVSNRGLDLDVSEFESVFEEFHVAHSTSLHSRTRARGRYHVGPMARWANNHDLLPSEVVALADEVGIGPVVDNPFRSIVVRGLETLFAIDEAVRIVTAYQVPDRAWVEVPPAAGRGWGATEAPRGLLYHRYDLDADGSILSADIVPPTAQNQPTIEADLRAVVDDHLAERGGRVDAEELRHHCEQSIRNYDPCISCSTHFLDLTVDGAAT